MNPKIVINALSARNGGGETYIKNILQHIPKDLNLEVVIYAQKKLNIKIDSRVTIKTPKWPTKNSILRFIWEKFIFRKILLVENPNLLFCPGGLISTPTPKTCKTVTMFRNMLPFDKTIISKMPFGIRKIRYLLLKKEMLNSMRNADFVIFISKYCRDIIYDYINIPKSTVIHHGISDKFRNQTIHLDRPSALQKRDYLLYVSRFDIHKNHENLVIAFANLPTHISKNLNLVFIGEKNGKQYEKIKQIIIKQKVEDRVVALGHVKYEELPKFYANSKAIIYASSCENCPNILLESLGSGRPVIASNVMPMPEFGGPDLCYFSPFDVNSIENALLKVLTSSDYSEKIANAALAKSLDFTWNCTGKKTWNLLYNISLEQKQPNGTS